MFNGPISTSPPAGFTPGVLVIRNSTIASNYDDRFRRRN